MNTCKNDNENTTTSSTTTTTKNNNNDHTMSRESDNSIKDATNTAVTTSIEQRYRLRA